MRALIVVDLQDDFMPGGTLAVPDGDQVVPIANRLMPQFDLVLATQDWHPANHGSFASQHPGHEVGDLIKLHGLDQILWPDHCIKDTPGAAFAAGFDTTRIDKVFHKGTDPTIDSYSAIFDNGHRKSTGLSEYLNERGVQDVYLIGVATDYCVKFTALDARELGLATKLILEGTRSVELKAGDYQQAIAQMQDKGVEILHEHEVR